MGWCLESSKIDLAKKVMQFQEKFQNMTCAHSRLPISHIQKQNLDN